MTLKQSSKKPKPKIPTEHWEQVQIIQWWRKECEKYDLPEWLLYACPNGGGRSISQAMALRAEGVRAGIPDLFLAYPKAGYSGLYIELKRLKGSNLRPEQVIALKELRKFGYETALCYGHEMAITAIKNYLEGLHNA